MLSCQISYLVNIQGSTTLTQLWIIFYF